MEVIAKLLEECVGILVITSGVMLFTCVCVWLLDIATSPHSPTELGGGGVPLVQGQTDDRQAKQAVNTPVNEGVNKPPVYEYMDVFTPKTDISILRELGKQGWKAIQISEAKRELDDQPAIWVLLMREVR